MSVQYAQECLYITIQYNKKVRTLQALTLCRKKHNTYAKYTILIGHLNTQHAVLTVKLYNYSNSNFIFLAGSTIAVSTYEVIMLHQSFGMASHTHIKHISPI